MTPLTRTTQSRDHGFLRTNRDQPQRGPAIEHRTAPADLAGSVSTYFLALAVPALIYFLTAPILTRILPATEYAHYILALSLIAAAAALNSWIGMAILRFYPAAKQSGSDHDFLRKVLSHGMLSACLVAACAIAAILLFHTIQSFDFSNLLIAAAITFVIVEFSTILLYVARAKHLPRIYMMFSAWKAAGGLALGIAIVLLLKTGAVGIILGIGIAVCAGLPLLIRSALAGYQNASKIVHSKNRWNAGIRPLLAYGIPLVVAEFAAWTLRASDRWAIEIVRGPNETGLYSAAYSIAEASMLLVAGTVHLAARPLEAGIWEHGTSAQISEFASRSTRVYLLLAMPIALLITAMARPITTVLLPPHYAETASVMPWVGFAVLLLGLQQRLQAPLAYARTTWPIAISATVGAAVNLSANLALIPRFGYQVAAVTTLVGYGTFCALVGWYARRYLRWQFPLRSLLRATLAAVISSLIAGWLAAHLHLPDVLVLVASATIGMTLYVTLLIVLREVDWPGLLYLFSSILPPKR